MFKCLTIDLRSWHDKTCKWRPYQWMTPLDDPNNKPGDNTQVCGIGYHLGKSMDCAIGYGGMPCRIFYAEGRHLVGEDFTKARFRTAVIREEVTPPFVLACNRVLLEYFSVRKRLPPDSDWVVHETYSKMFKAIGYTKLEQQIDRDTLSKIVVPDMYKELFNSTSAELGVSVRKHTVREAFDEPRYAWPGHSKLTLITQSWLFRFFDTILRDKAKLYLFEWSGTPVPEKVQKAINMRWKAVMCKYIPIAFLKNKLHVCKRL